MLLNSLLFKTRQQAKTKLLLSSRNLTAFHKPNQANKLLDLVKSDNNIKNSQKFLSTFSVNPNRIYRSVPIPTKSIENNNNNSRRFLLVLGNSSCNFTNNRRMMSTSTSNLKLMKVYDNILKSKQDSRLYRGLLLDNGLKCLLISDPSTDRSAASLDVHAGYMLDPEKFPGLAHFLEHMLFMGSKKVYTIFICCLRMILI
jgi:hypothetical protein